MNCEEPAVGMLPAARGGLGIVLVLRKSAAKWEITRLVGRCAEDVLKMSFKYARCALIL